VTLLSSIVAAKVKALARAELRNEFRTDPDFLEFMATFEGAHLFYCQKALKVPDKVGKLPNVFSGSG
jgi:hypothetical protein